MSGLFKIKFIWAPEFFYPIGFDTVIHRYGTPAFISQDPDVYFQSFQHCILSLKVEKDKLYFFIQSLFLKSMFVGEAKRELM